MTHPSTPPPPSGPRKPLDPGRPAGQAAKRAA